MCNNLADELILLENRTRENFTLMYFLGMWVFSIYCEINTLYNKKKKKKQILVEVIVFSI